MVLRWAADNGRGESFLLGGYVRTDFVSIRTFLLFLIPLSSFQGNENPILGFFSSGVQSSKGSRNLSNFFYLSVEEENNFASNKEIIRISRWTRDISLFLSSFISYYNYYVRPFLQ